MKTLFAALAFAFGLAGCATQPPQIPTTEYRFVAVPTELTEHVTLTPPPEPVAYSQLTCDLKEATLINLVQERTAELGVANARLTGIRDWSVKQSQIYEAPAP